MDALTLPLVLWAVGSLVFLIAIEGLSVAKGLPTISQRVRDLGNNGRIVVIWSMFVVGYLAAHFWDNFVSGCPH